MADRANTSSSVSAQSCWDSSGTDLGEQLSEGEGESESEKDICENEHSSRECSNSDMIQRDQLADNAMLCDAVDRTNCCKFTSKRKHSVPKLDEETVDDILESENGDYREVEEEDTASKLLMSIQVLPRIPKRKQQTDNYKETSVDEKSSYQSVLERVETVTNRGMGSYPNWAMSGWKRSANDETTKRKPLWNRKVDRFGKGSTNDHQKQSLSKELSGINKESVRSNSELSVSKIPTEIPSANILIVDNCNELSPERPTFSGPLPTLPFEEQMKERARLRALSRNASSDILTIDETVVDMRSVSYSDNEHGNNYESSDKLPSAIKTECQEAKEVTSVKDESRNSCRNNNQAECSENVADNKQYVSGKKPPSANNHNVKPSSGHSQHVHDRNRNHKHSRSKEGNGNSCMPDPVRSSSPPLPYLPILPLFASVCSGNNSTATKSATAEAKLHENESKKYTSVTSKTVTFNCPEGADNPAGKKVKTKKLSDRKRTKPEDKASLQLGVVDVMKNYLRPYYMRREISKEEYKDIMRRTVTRICHGQSNTVSVSSSRIHKYATAYIEDVFKRRPDSSAKDKTGTNSSDVPPPPPPVT